MGRTLNILNAGSVEKLVKDTAARFCSLNQDVSVNSVSKGSVDCISEVQNGYPADLLILADSSIIKTMMFPTLTDWYLIFASNRMVLSSNPGYLKEGASWIDILTDEDIKFGHTDPAKDPCGYRALMVWKLADKDCSGLYDRLYNHPGRIVFDSPKSMINSLKEGSINYIFEYGSVCRENGLHILELDSSINLSDPLIDDHYSSVEVTIDKEKDIKVRGASISYALTIPSNSANYTEAAGFIKLLMDSDLESYGIAPKLQHIGNTEKSFIE